MGIGRLRLRGAEFLFEVMKCSKIDRDDGCTTLNTPKATELIYFTWVNCICELYLDKAFKNVEYLLSCNNECEYCMDEEAENFKRRWRK